MRSMKARAARLATMVAVLAAGLAVLAPVASAKVAVSFERLDGYASPGTPAKYNKVGILKIGSPRAKNVLVLNPGTSASAAYFAPLARDIASRARNWQVWAVERRENLLEDHSVFDKAKAGKVTDQQTFDYYLGYLSNPAITDHFQAIPNDTVAYAKNWGMNVEIQDLRRVVKKAQQRGRRVVVGGHSLGGSITTAYATWDFNGKAGRRGPLRTRVHRRRQRPHAGQRGPGERVAERAGGRAPWLTFGGIPAPFTGLFNTSGALGAIIGRRTHPSLGQTFPLLPANLKPPVPVTNLAQYGYALDTETSPPGLDRRAGAPRPPGRERRSARLGPGR